MIKKTDEIIKEANGVLITAGAGIGVDSGLPDFRGKEGFWKVYPKSKRVKFKLFTNGKPSLVYCKCTTCLGFLWS